MHDRRDGGHDRGGPRHGHGHHGHRSGPGEGRGREDCGPDDRRGDRDGRRGGGPDTRFLQLEMSQVLYSEAEAITKQAFRELLVEAAKERWRERFGEKITGLAELAVDELMGDVLASLEIEARIAGRKQERDSVKDRLRDIFTERDGGEGDGDGPDEGPDENH